MTDFESAVTRPAAQTPSFDPADAPDGKPAPGRERHSMAVETAGAPHAPQDAPFDPADAPNGKALPPEGFDEAYQTRYRPILSGQVSPTPQDLADMQSSGQFEPHTLAQLTKFANTPTNTQLDANYDAQEARPLSTKLGDAAAAYGKNFVQPALDAAYAPFEIAANEGGGSRVARTAASVTEGATQASTGIAQMPWDFAKGLYNKAANLVSPPTLDQQHQQARMDYLYSQALASQPQSLDALRGGFQPYPHVTGAVSALASLPAAEATLGVAGKGISAALGKGGSAVEKAAANAKLTPARAAAIQQALDDVARPALKKQIADLEASPSVMGKVKVGEEMDGTPIFEDRGTPDPAAIKKLAGLKEQLNSGKPLVDAAPASIQDAEGPAQSLKSQAVDVAGKVLSATGAAANKVGSLPDVFGKWVADKIAGDPVLAEKIAARMGSLENIAGAVGLAGGGPILHAITLVKGLEWGGAAVKGLGDFMSRVATADPTNTFGKFAALGADADAPGWMRWTANLPPVRLAAASANVAARTAASVAKASAVGAAYGAVTHDNLDDIAASAGGFGSFGLLGAAHAKDAAIYERNQAGLIQAVQDHLNNGGSLDTLREVGDGPMMLSNTLKSLLGDHTIRFSQASDPNSPFAPGGSAANQAGWTDPSTKTIWIDPSARTPTETLIHEAMHPIFDGEVANRPQLAQQIDDAFKRQGNSLEDAKAQYVAKELQKPVSDPAVAQRVAERDAANPNWIYSEVMAETAVQALSGKKLTDVTDPSLASKALEPVKNILEKAGVTFGEGSKPGTVLPGFENVLNDPELRKVAYQLVRAQKAYRPGVTPGVEQGTKITKDLWGKHPGAPVPAGGNDFVARKPDGSIVNRKAFQTSRIVKSRRAEMNQLFPGDGTPLKRDDTTPKVSLRQTISGNVERSGTQLGDDFYKSKSFGPESKTMAKDLEDAMAKGETRSGWYQQIGKGEDWHGSVQKDTGAIEVQHKDFVPTGFMVDKQGNVLVRNYSLTALERKAQKWGGRHGDLSLDLWGGDVAKFRDDVKQYLQNHSEGIPGESNNLGVEKKNTINAFLVGGNRAFEAKNPLRAKLKGDDRAGVVRSYRLDRLETLEPGQTEVAKPNYGQQVQNFSPKGDEGKTEDKGAGARLNELKGLANPTPEEAAERDALQKRSDQNNSRAAFEAMFRKSTPAKTPDEAAANVVNDAAAQFSPKAEAQPEKEGLPYSAGDKPLELVHYSRKGDLSSINPTFMGKGRATADDARGLNKAFLFVKGSPFGGDHGLFDQSNVYKATLDGKTIYDPAAHGDPLGFYSVNREQAEQGIKKAGYSGVLVKTSDGRQVVVSFKPVKVDKLGYTKEAGTHAVGPVELRKDIVGPAQRETGKPRPKDWPEGQDMWPDKIEHGFKTTKGVFVPAAKAYVPQAKPPQFSPTVEDAKGRETGNDEVRAHAAGYMQEAGLPGDSFSDYHKVDEAHAKNVADAYEAAKHNPDNAEVRAAYDAFGKETKAQWNYITSKGVKMEPWTKDGQPYKDSATLRADIANNKHLFYFPSEGGFGEEGKNKAAHPLMAPSGVKIGGKDVPVNDIFRAVHDYFGHAKEGYEFGPRGEYNAFLAHSRMYSEAARPAMAAETLGQNSWVNYGKHLRGENGKVPKKGEPGFVPLEARPFAEQKATLLPRNLVEKQFSPPADDTKEHVKEAAIRFADGKVFTGTFHGAAVEKAEQAFSKLSEAALKNKFKRVVDGYVTNTGRFLDREEAYALAKQAKQLTDKDYQQAQMDNWGFAAPLPGSKEAVDHEKKWGEKPAPPSLEATSFEIAKKFSPREDKEKGPLTQRGKTLEKLGYSVRYSGPVKPGSSYREISATKNGDEVAKLYYRLAGPDEDRLAVIDMVETHPSAQRQGLGTALYHELGARLHKEGISRVGGDALSQVPLNIRKKVFGDFSLIENSGHKSISESQARSTLPEALTTPDEADLGNRVWLENKISPDAKFSPALSKRGEDLEGGGFTFRRYNDGGLVTVEAHKADKRAGAIQYRLPKTGTGAEITWVGTEPDFRRKGIATALYHEMGADLQKRGIKTVGGSAVSQIPLDLRNKIFGDFLHRDSVKVPAEAPMVSRRESYAVSKINQDKQFSPKVEEEHALDPKAVARYAKRIVKLTQDNKGVTFNIAKGTSKFEGYGVSIYPDRSEILDPDKVTAPQVEQFIHKNADLLHNPDNAVGTWLDEDSGKVYLDVSSVHSDRSFAEYAGWKYNQKAIWDATPGAKTPEHPAGLPIDTGGTGEPLEEMVPATERLDNLRREHELQNPRTGQTQIPGLGRLVLDPRSTEVKNIRDMETLRPDRKLTPTEQAASDLARKEVRERVQLLPSADDKVKARRALLRGIPEVGEYLSRQANNPDFDNGSEWYRKDIEKMEETTTKTFPETKAENKMTMFKMMLAAFSGGAKPKENYQLASEAFAHYLTTGEVPATSDYRISQEGKKRILGRNAGMTAEKLGKLIEETGGEAGFVKYLLSKHDETIKGNKEAFGAMDLGPKMGRFFLNLMGHADEVTVDLWASRTFQRWMGTPFAHVESDGVTKQGLPDIPTDEERNVIIGAFQNISEEINKSLPKEKHLTAMAVQAILWFYEKDLYSSRGVKVDRGTFSEAAKDYAKNPIHKRTEPVVTGLKHKIDPNQTTLFK